MNPVNPPPQPPKEQPLAAALWKIKSDIIRWLEDFKDGLFRGNINWSVKMIDIFDILLSSPGLVKDEKLVVIKFAQAIGMLTADTLQKRRDRLEKSHHYMEDSRRAFYLMVESDKAMRGRHTIIEALKSVGLGQLKFEADVSGTSQSNSGSQETTVRETCGSNCSLDSKKHQEQALYAIEHKESVGPTKQASSTSQPQTSGGSEQPASDVSEQQAPNGD